MLQRIGSSLAVRVLGVAGAVTMGCGLAAVVSTPGVGRAHPLPASAPGQPNLPAAARLAELAPPASDTVSAGRDTIAVSGIGTVEGTPDVMIATFVVSVRRATVRAAMDASNAAARRLIASLRNHHVASRDIQTTDVSLYPSTDYRGHRDGYAAGESVTARLHDLHAAGSILSAAATSSGNDVSVQGISFDIQSSEALLHDARSRAFADAKSKAQQYADLAGRSLGAALSISEVIQQPAPQSFGGGGFASAGAAALTSAVPVAAGSQQLGVTVTVVWALAH
jgi:uncharacterized protein YggE